MVRSAVFDGKFLQRCGRHMLGNVALPFRRPSAPGHGHARVYSSPEHGSVFTNKTKPVLHPVNRASSGAPCCGFTTALAGGRVRRLAGPAAV